MLREHAMYTHHCFVLACCLGAALPALASDLFAPAELSDQELSQLRGRYVLPGRIVSFGVTMSSTWQNASGRVLGARVDLQVRQNLARPVLNVTLVDRPGDAPPPVAGNGQVLGGAGLAQTQGSARASAPPATTTAPAMASASRSATARRRRHCRAARRWKVRSPSAARPARSRSRRTAAPCNWRSRPAARAPACKASAPAAWCRAWRSAETATWCRTWRRSR